MVTLHVLPRLVTWVSGRGWSTLAVPWQWPPAASVWGALGAGPGTLGALSTAWEKYASAWLESATMRAMTSVCVNCRITLGGRVTSFVVAACWTLRWVAVLTGLMGGPPGRGGGGGALCTMVADLTLCTSS